MYFITIGQEWERKEHSKKFKTIIEAEDAAYDASKRTKETVYIFEETEGYIKEVTAKGE